MADQELVRIDGSIPSEVAEAMKVLHPSEGFRPFDDLPGEWERVGKPLFKKTNGSTVANGYTVKFQNKVTKKVITLSGNLLLKSRVLSGPVAMAADKSYIAEQKFYLKSEAEDWWNKSGFFADMVDTEAGYEIPMTLNIEGVIINEDQETGKALPAFNLYPGFMNWAIKKLNRGEQFPQLQEFQEALAIPPGDSARDKDLFSSQTACVLPDNVDINALKIEQTSFRLVLGPVSLEA